MPKTLRTAVEKLQQDVARWKEEIATLEAEGHFQFTQHLRAWVEEAERIIGASEKPHA